MEHKSEDTRAVVARYIRRRWKRPAQVAGGLAVATVLVGFLPFRAKPQPKYSLTPGERVLAGQVESLKSQAVGSPFGGSVVAIAVKPGQKVQQGQLLFKMDPRPFKDALAVAKSARHEAAVALIETKAARHKELATLEAEAATIKGMLMSAQSGAQPVQDPYAGEGETDFEAQPVTQDPDQVYALQTRLSELRSHIEDRKRNWTPMLQVAAEQLRASEREVKRIGMLLAQVERRSPMSGIVTAVNAEPGSGVAAYSPVIRVDDPSGYRVVTLVDQRLREQLKPGAPVPVLKPNEAGVGKLEKIVPGRDEELFQYYVYVKPSEPAVLKPGQSVEVKVTPGSAMASN